MQINNPLRSLYVILLLNFIGSLLSLILLQTYTSIHYNAVTGFMIILRVFFDQILVSCTTHVNSWWICIVLIIIITIDRSIYLQSYFILSLILNDPLYYLRGHPAVPLGWIPLNNTPGPAMHALSLAFLWLSASRRRLRVTRTHCLHEFLWEGVFAIQRDKIRRVLFFCRTEAWRKAWYLLAYLDRHAGLTTLEDDRLIRVDSWA